MPHSRGNATIRVSAFIEGICFDGKTGKEARNVSYPAKDSYTDKDSQDQASRYFKRNMYPRGEDITAAEYYRLRDLYENEPK